MTGAGVPVPLTISGLPPGKLQAKVSITAEPVMAGVKVTDNGAGPLNGEPEKSAVGGLTTGEA